MFSIYNSLVAYARVNKDEPLKVLKALLSWASTSYHAFGIGIPVGNPLSDENITYGACGVRWKDMAAVLKHAGFQTRQIGLYSVPVQGNHVTGEVKIKDQWVFIDPPTGIYFEDRNGNPLSLSE